MGLLQFEVQTHLILSHSSFIPRSFNNHIFFFRFFFIIFDLIFNLDGLWRCNLYDYFFFREIAVDCC